MTAVNWLMNALTRTDDFVRDEAIARAAAARAVGQERNTNDFLDRAVSDREGLARRVASDLGWADDRRAKFLAALDKVQGNQGAQMNLAERYGDRMKRGPAGLMQQGFVEAVNEGIATNAYVRRGALPAAIVGGGALLTEGAQQLLALMGFIEEGNETAARANESPLA